MVKNTMKLFEARAASVATSSGAGRSRAASLGGYHVARLRSALLYMYCEFSTK
jgi:hypothetical protein